MTDYNVTLFWEETRLDAYILPHPDLVAPYIAKGMPAERLFPYGIPVTPQIAPERDIAAAKQAYGIDPECKHVIVAGGSMGAGKLPRTVRALDETLPSSVVISAVCGNNAAAKEELEAMGNPRVRVLGYVSPLNAFLASADVVITKAGRPHQHGNAGATRAPDRAAFHPAHRNRQRRLFPGAWAGL